MNVREGTRRLALLFGYCGAIVGAFLAYSAITGVSDYSDLGYVPAGAATSHGTAKLSDIDETATAALNAPPTKWVPPERDQLVQGKAPATLDLPPAQPKQQLQRKDDRLPIKNYIVPLLFPACGFLLCWGTVRMLAWVAIGFKEPNC
jgi:hypothetical protein